MRRRELMQLLGGAASWPLAARAQQSEIPVIGLLDPGSPDAVADRLRGLRRGLKEAVIGIFDPVVLPLEGYPYGKGRLVGDRDV